MRDNKKLNRLSRHFVGLLHEELKKEFSGDPNMLKAIEASEKDTTFNYDVISEQRDYERAKKIAEHESELEMLGMDRIADILVNTCLVPHSVALLISRTAWEKHFLES